MCGLNGGDSGHVGWNEVTDPEKCPDCGHPWCSQCANAPWGGKDYKAYRSRLNKYPSKSLKGVKR